VFILDQENWSHVFSLPKEAIPTPFRAVLRGIGQIFFQENALTGSFCAVGIAVSSLPMAAGAIAGSAIGMATARVLRFDQAEVNAGIYSSNATLVGIATLFFFRPGAASIAMLVIGCVAAALVTRLLRALLPVPTFTSPFFLTTWALYFLGPALGAVGVELEGRPVAAGFVEAVAHGISQALFQANVWTGILCIVGIALSDWRHASWAVVGSIVGIMVANYHVTTAARALDPERLIERAFSENIALGLYSYNTILPAIALFRWTRSLMPPLLGILLSVPLTELVPMLGLPALSAPNVVATWLVLTLGFVEERAFDEQAATP